MDVAVATVPVRRSSGWIVASFLAGGAVALMLGVYGRLHDPSGARIFSLIFTSTLTMKVWLATGAVTLAVLQLLTAARFFELIRWPRGRSPLAVRVHRASGTMAFVLTLPVAYHCLWSLGFSDLTARRFAHSLAGCTFYGAFATKMLLLRTERPWPLIGTGPAPAYWPVWVFMVSGGLVFSALTVAWYSSALWFFTTLGVEF